MTARPHDGEVRCRACGAVLAADHDAVFCSPCLASRRDYNPFHDAGLGDRILAVLTSHPHQTVNVYRELGIEHCGRSAWHCVYGHIKRLRRHGHIIHGHPAVGYEWRGQRPPRSVRLRPPLDPHDDGS